MVSRRGPKLSLARILKFAVHGVDAYRRAARESYRGAFDLAKKDMAAGALRQTAEMDFPKTIEGTSASIRLKSAVQFLDKLLMQVTSN